jgi:hypothetical protein
MSDAKDAGFGKFVPGFDFLQNLAKGSSQTVPQMSNLGSWIAPTLNVEELDKRISELKTVHFWLEQNSKALGATVQALEVQKMTLATLKGMNVNFGELANAFTPKPATPASSAEPLAPEKAASTAKPAATAAAGLVDPMQLWGALTQQFQQIAAGAMKDAAKNSVMDTAKNTVAGFAKETVKATKKAAASAAQPGAVAKKTTARKTVKKTPARNG